MPRSRGTTRKSLIGAGGLDALLKDAEAFASRRLRHGIGQRPSTPPADDRVYLLTRICRISLSLLQDYILEANFRIQPAAF